MNQLESTSPGTKAQFLWYLDGRRAFAMRDELRLSGRARGQPTTGRFCAFCRAQAQILGERLEGPGAERGSPGRPSDDRETAEALADEVMPVEIYGTPRR